MTANSLQLIERWMVRLPGPHMDRSDLEYWLEQMEPVVVDGLGEFFQTEDVESTLGWTWYEDGATVTLCPFDTLVESRMNSSPYRFLDLHAAISADRILFADMRSHTVWGAGRTKSWHTAGRLDRPDDLDPGLRFMKFRASPSGRWVVVFVESGFAAFEDFELKMVEQYGELLWEPMEVTDADVRLDHYELGERRIRLTA